MATITYHIHLWEGWSLDEIRTLAPHVIKVIASAINTLIEYGAATVVAPGCLPLGCFSSVLTTGMSPNMEDYDPETGCLKHWNELSDKDHYHLELAIIELYNMHFSHLTIEKIIYELLWKPFIKPN